MRVAGLDPPGREVELVAALVEQSQRRHERPDAGVLEDEEDLHRPVSGEWGGVGGPGPTGARQRAHAGGRPLVPVAGELDDRGSSENAEARSGRIPSP